MSYRRRIYYTNEQKVDWQGGESLKIAASASDVGGYLLMLMNQSTYSALQASAVIRPMLCKSRRCCLTTVPVSAIAPNAKVQTK